MIPGPSYLSLGGNGPDLLGVVARARAHVRKDVFVQAVNQDGGLKERRRLRICGPPPNRTCRLRAAEPLGRLDGTVMRACTDSRDAPLRWPRYSSPAPGKYPEACRGDTGGNRCRWRRGRAGMHGMRKRAVRWRAAEVAAA